MYILNRELLLPGIPEEVFPFFGDPWNLNRLTPSWLHFQILTSEPIEMKPGLLMDYRLRLRGVPIRWQSEITVWEPPHCFVDEQRRGPYRVWIHEHRFEREGDQTLVLDRVRYDHLGGDPINRWLVAPDLQRIFSYRRQQLEKIFSPSNPPEKQSLPKCEKDA